MRESEVFCKVSVVYQKIVRAMGHSAHFGSCGAQWDAHVPSDRPLLPIRACCGVRVRDVRLSKSLGVGHLIP